MTISTTILDKFKLEPQTLKNGKIKYELFNHYAIELLERNGKLLYEVFWENWGRRIGFSEGEITNESDFVYFVEYSESCNSSFE